MTNRAQAEAEARVAATDTFTRVYRQHPGTMQGKAFIGGFVRAMTSHLPDESAEGIRAVADRKRGSGQRGIDGMRLAGEVAGYDHRVEQLEGTRDWKKWHEEHPYVPHPRMKGESSGDYDKRLRKQYGDWIRDGGGKADVKHVADLKAGDKFSIPEGPRGGHMTGRQEKAVNRETVTSIEHAPNGGTSTIHTASGKEILQSPDTMVAHHATRTPGHVTAANLKKGHLIVVDGAPHRVVDTPWRKHNTVHFTVEDSQGNRKGAGVPFNDRFEKHSGKFEEPKSAEHQRGIESGLRMGARHEGDGFGPDDIRGFAKTFGDNAQKTADYQKAIDEPFGKPMGAPHGGEVSDYDKGHVAGLHQHADKMEAAKKDEVSSTNGNPYVPGTDRHQHFEEGYAGGRNDGQHGMTAEEARGRANFTDGIGTAHPEQQARNEGRSAGLRQHANHWEQGYTETKANTDPHLLSDENVKAARQLATPDMATGQALSVHQGRLAAVEEKLAAKK